MIPEQYFEICLRNYKVREVIPWNYSFYKFNYITRKAYIYILYTSLVIVEFLLTKKYDQSSCITDEKIFTWGYQERNAWYI